MTPTYKTNKPHKKGHTPRILARAIVAASCLGLVLGALLYITNTTHEESWLLWSLAGLTFGTGLLAASAK